MNIQNLQRNYNNECLNKLNFKGKVSPEFIEYVGKLRNDCLESVSVHNYNLINNVCDDILETANRVMTKCFPEANTLSIDTSSNLVYDVILTKNSVIKKYIPSYSVTSDLISKRGASSPIGRLIKLNSLFKGNLRGLIFADVCRKDICIPFSFIDYECSNFASHNKNKKMYSDFKKLLEWWQKNINLLNYELPQKVQCLEVAEKCREILSKLEHLQ